jgi:ABC-type polysaccharide/polyol phosphate transport system ATPase subunit
MSDPAIRVSNLGKRYRVSRVQERHRALRGYNTLREALSDGAAGLVRGVASRLGRNSHPPSADGSIWALRDVTLDVQPSEVVGVIGNNGAGKSTLLKILSRVTRPTTGWVKLRGRVGSLLEVGTGFHPELTGRENIYLSGAILGMRRAEIGRKFDQILEFAEVERFIDTPLKRYSSGMYLRLAFAVAAHLEPEILLVDEVLAVGDAAFQRKCLGKMDDVAREGRTVLFVSHNMDAIQRLCPQSVLIEHGQIIAYADSGSVVSRYLSSDNDRAKPNTWIDLSSMERRRGTGEARFTTVRYSSPNEDVAFHAYPGGSLEFTMAIVSTSPRSVESLAVLLSTRTGTKLINADTLSQGTILRLKEGRNNITMRIKEVYLNAGVYVVGLWLSRSPGVILDHVQAAFDIDVVPAQSRGLGATPLFDGVVPCRFEVSASPSNDKDQGISSAGEWE